MEEVGGVSAFAFPSTHASGMRGNIVHSVRHRSSEHVEAAAAAAARNGSSPSGSQRSSGSNSNNHVQEQLSSSNFSYVGASVQMPLVGSVSKRNATQNIAAALDAIDSWMQRASLPQGDKGGPAQVIVFPETVGA